MDKCEEIAFRQRSKSKFQRRVNVVWWENHREIDVRRIQAIGKSISESQGTGKDLQDSKIFAPNIKKYFLFFCVLEKVF